MNKQLIIYRLKTRDGLTSEYKEYDQRFHPEIINCLPTKAGVMGSGAVDSDSGLEIRTYKLAKEIPAVILEFEEI